jgi:riboflavin kinase/FMN adenylyltransferase
LGFPTANLETHKEQFPPDGVYAVRATVNDDQYNGVANIGIRPTVSGEGSRILEVHLFDFTGDLYGKTMDVAFLQFLRPEQKFENLDALRAQIQHDAAEARDWIDQHRKMS